MCSAQMRRSQGALCVLWTRSGDLCACLGFLSAAGILVAGLAWNVVAPAPGAVGSSDLPSSSVAAESALSAVSCLSASSCTAVGYLGAGTSTESWNGVARST